MGLCFNDLQQALVAASSGHEIWVAAGTYKPTSNNDPAISFVMRDNIAIYGGFKGTETSLSQRNPVSSQTILSGDIGTPGNTSDNTYHVIRNDNNNIGYSAILDGFIITAGVSGLTGGPYGAVCLTREPFNKLPYHQELYIYRECCSKWRWSSQRIRFAEVY